jgi:hypothetical protein
MAKRRLDNLYEQFQNILSIEKHFQIERYHFEVMRINDTTFHLNSRLIISIELELPEDILRCIESYLKDTAKIEINYPHDYPFKCPKFTLLDGNEKYINHLHVLNYAYDRDWSPAITFEKDILYLIQYII